MPSPSVVSDLPESLEVDITGLEAGAVVKGDLIVLSYGDQMGLTGGTNTLTIVRVGDRVAPRG